METQTVTYNPTQLRMGLPENVILSTREYDMFRYDPLNRPLDPRHVDELVEAISAKNLLREYSILVTSDMVIVDGQHRHAAAKRLGVELFFQVSPRMQIKDAAAVNRTNQEWRTEDWLHHFCQQGFPEYLKVKEFWNRYSWMGLTTAYKLCASGTRVHNNMFVAFTSGEYVANNLEFAVKVADAAETFRPWVKFWRDQRFVTAVANAHRIEGYDHARMLRKMEYLSSKLTKCADLNSYFAVFTEIYNYKERAENHLLFKRK